ncbi:AP2/ERF and B3 domain-containing protein [Cinnamomum micranthum f. kanehirae]|uniref:AP2/ERF and B3 domain-containing protein n=1 Tax=Cinnamomum micranthum f. kanehirae TaxID=337451 RepID=A0A443PRH5_9MAGN|nr:AP2/ERF and B3 domain-containing protein [Cinnamomum micranthum f. kanehirae]
MSTTSNTVMTREGSASNSITNPYQPNKRLRHKNPSTPVRFKGVVLQQNGHWGSQIYANHQRIWLGTFKSEQEAALAYDSASIKLRSGDSHRNFPWTNLTIQEPSFQELFSIEAVLNMIKDGSYESKFADYLRTRSAKATFDGLLDPNRGFVNQEGVLCQQIFQKELTPSDVGKLNRLVIPKKHATKFFPPLNEGRGIGEESSSDGGSKEEVQLEFFDNNMRSWKFRYCYWKSSQSFVFTRGWNRFVKDKQLKAKDVVVFYECRYREVSTVKKGFWMIDIASDGSCENVKNCIDSIGGDVELQLCLGGLSGHGPDWKDNKVNEEKEEELPDMHKKRVKLFGIDINK